MLTGVVASARTQYSKSELVGGKRHIDIVVSCRSFFPEGDGNGNHQNDNELSQEDRVDVVCDCPTPASERGWRELQIFQGMDDCRDIEQL